jgi:hypothetical protein
MTSSFSEIDRRAFRHDVVDGLTEMAIALFFLVPAFTLEEPAFSWMIILPILFMSRGLERIRARHTWPRIGYVRPRGEPAGEMIKGMLSYVVAVVAVIGIGLFVIRGEIEPGGVRQASPLLAALLFGGGLIYSALRSGLRRYWFLFAASVALGTALSTVQIPGRYASVQMYLGGMAIITFTVGLVTFVRFLHRHPVRNDEGASHAE